MRKCKSNPRAGLRTKKAFTRVLEEARRIQAESLAEGHGFDGTGRVMVIPLQVAIQIAKERLIRDRYLETIGASDDSYYRMVALSLASDREVK